MNNAAATVATMINVDAAWSTLRGERDNEFDAGCVITPLLNPAVATATPTAAGLSSCQTLGFDPSLFHGKMYSDVDEARRALVDHAAQCGFALRKRRDNATKRKGRKAGMTKVVFVCSCAGVYRGSRGREIMTEMRKRQYVSKCTNCKWEVTAKLGDRGWAIGFTNLYHNHPSFPDIRLFSTARRPTEAAKRMLESLVDSGIKAHQVVRAVEECHPTARLTTADVHNARARLRQEQLGSRPEMEVPFEPTDEYYADDTLSKKKCVRCCSPGLRPMSEESARLLAQKVPGWELTKDDNGCLILSRSWKTKTFLKGIEFFKVIGGVAEAEGHHPNLHLVNWNDVRVDIWTHAAGGLTENDFILAAKINELNLQDLLRNQVPGASSSTVA